MESFQMKVNSDIINKYMETRWIAMTIAPTTYAKSLYVKFININVYEQGRIKILSNLNKPDIVFHRDTTYVSL